jgi:DNA repair protein SbcC/Rad50
MILKKIILNNIRSYENEEIEFQKGSVLLSGDIGSGKTSVLLAIEFALFGLQPGQRGSSLLRNGEKKGGVIINFEVGDKEIIIERTLKKAKTISQDYCSIVVDGEKKEISVIELKNKVLELLDYPKEFSKKQNILYKFTVYTPQEEMKQIILQDPETRINTLRHVFGIDKYKKILENISIITSKIREEKRIKEGITKNFETDKLDILSKEKELQLKSTEIILYEKELLEKVENRKKIQEERQEIFKKIEEKNKLNQEIEKTNIMISNKNETISSNKKIINQLNFQITELKELNFDESKSLKLEKQIDFKRIEKEKLNEFNIEITTKINSLNIRNSEKENIKNKIINIEICPTCLQDVGLTYKDNVINNSNLEISKNTEKIKSFTIEKEDISQKIMKINNEISFYQKEINELNIIKIKYQSIDEKQKYLEEIDKLNYLLEKDLELLRKHLETLKNSILELNKFNILFEEKQKELEESLRMERTSEIKFAELKKEIEVFSFYIKELKDKIRETEEIKKRLNYLIELENWLSKKFVLAISSIEKNVMVKLKAEFSQLFSKWFYMLVSDSFNVRLSDNFTPIIEQQDYEIDYAYLSGGERTAVALAYRLALNQVINSLMSKIKTKDFIILDEPTDGFSEQQLDKIRDVLQQLNVKQLIIVSHEQKIESFVEEVIRFKKENNISKKEQ